ncbi:MAG TPA: phenylacetic acid degradation protein PaaY [Nitrosomonas sp.]|nr:phenylacetic acid degradation protein PaaY [Nitrosomonas sp.]
MTKDLIVYSIDGVIPVVHPAAYVHPSAVLIGDVIVGSGCYVGPCASLRGDFGRLILKEGANVQDSCVMHGFPNADTVIEKNGHIGHGAIIHGCHVGENALIGMNAVVMDGVLIGESTVVAASSFIKAGTVIPARVLVAGAPAKILRPLREDELKWKITGTKAYHDLTLRSLKSMKSTPPLAAVDPDRKRLEVKDFDVLIPKHKSS